MESESWREGGSERESERDERKREGKGESGTEKDTERMKRDRYPVRQREETERGDE